MSYRFTQLKASLLRVLLLLALSAAPAWSKHLPPASVPAQAPEKGKNHFLIGYEAQLYRPGVSPNPFHILSAGMEFSSEDPGFSSKVDLNLSFNPQNLKVWALRNPDARVTWNPLGPIRFTFGRSLRRWNELDSHWNLGFIQPIDQWDRFRPAQQGLIGAFLDWDAGPFTFHAFGTYLMYPENIPNVIIENGTFASYHPQAISSTPQTITLLNQNTPLYYEIDYPSISEVVLRPGLLASLETSPKSPLIFRASYGFLPYNYFVYALRGTLSIPNNQVQIQIKPRLNQHQIVSGDLGYRIPETPIDLGVSALSDIPAQESLTNDYTYAPMSAALLVSPWIGWEQPGFSLRASQLLWHGGTEADVGPYATPNGTVISSHVFYRNATQVSAHLSTPFLGERSRIVGRWIHEHEIGADALGGDLTIPVQTSMESCALWQAATLFRPVSTGIPIGAARC